jgi:hypothetical protein
MLIARLEAAYAGLVGLASISVNDRKIGNSIWVW